jgi:DNA-binding transcriptional regulator YdaS (Cro superfamily)
MSNLPVKYHFHELNKLFGDYDLKDTMPCFRCNEPEAWDITIAFAQFGAAAHDELPRGTMPVMDAVFAPAPEVKPVESNVEPIEPGTEPIDTLSDLFMLRDYVIKESAIMAAAIKAVGGIRALARQLGARREAIEQWRRIPVERLQAVAKITGLPQHVLRPDLFDVSEPQSYYATKEEADEVWKWRYAWQLWLPLPYPPGFLPAHCCARRPQLALVVSK